MTGCGPLCLAAMHRYTPKENFQRTTIRFTLSIGVSIQDYSNGTGERNIITRFHLSPEQVQFFLTRLTAGFQEFEWSISKIFGEPDQYGYSTAQQFSISRHARHPTAGK